MTAATLPFRPSERIRMLLPAPLSRTAERGVPIDCAQGIGRGRLVAVEAEFTGFHPLEEAAGVPFAWSDGRGTVVCRMARPVTLRHVWLVVHATAPHGAPVAVSIDGGPAVQVGLVRGRRIVRIALGRRLRTAEVHLTVTSPSFVPARLVGSADERRLGVALERIILGRSGAACLAAAVVARLRRAAGGHGGRPSAAAIIPRRLLSWELSGGQAATPCGTRR